MRTRYRIFLILFIAVLSCTFVRAQQQYTTTNGLPSNTVYNSFRDSRGYIWFGTDKGACRFDGKNFKIYATEDGLPDNSVIDFFEDIKGRLWLFCFNGGGCYIYNNKVHNAGNDRLLAKMPAVSFQRVMCNGPDSSLYIAYTNTPLLKVTDTTISALMTYRVARGKPQPALCALQYAKDTLYVYDQTNSCTKLYHDKYAGSIPMHLSMTFIDGQKQYIVHTDTVFINKGNRRLASYSSKNIGYSKIIKIVTHDAHSFFACTNNGLLLVDFINHTQTWLLKDLQISSICQSISGNYWATALNKGIYKLNRELTSIEPITNISGSDLLQKNENLYRVTTDSVYSFNTSTLRQEPIRVKYNSAWKILGEDDHYLVCATKTNTILIDKKTGIIYDKVWEKAKPWKDDKELVRPVAGYFIPVDKNKLFFSGSVQYYCARIENNYAYWDADFLTHEAKLLCPKKCASNGRIYVLSAVDLLEFDPATNKTIKIDSFYNHYLPSDLFCFDNHIAVTSSAGKMILYTLGSRKRAIYDFNGKGISNIISLSRNKLIVVTNKEYKILTLTNATGDITMQSITYPFNSAEINQVYTCGTNLLMAVNNNLYKVNPTLINAHITRPVFFINNVLVNNVKDTSRHIVLNNTGSNNIFISLSPLYFGNPNISYKYRFVKDNNNSQWFYSDGGEFNLSLPSYGDYKIEFIAIADNNNTSASQFLYVSWPPPFYLTWWFFSILGLLFIALVIYMVYLYNQRKKLKFEKEMDLLQLEHKAINSLLNPHFVFNAINNIQNLVNKYRVDDANEYLARLSRLIRQNIENLQFNLITAEKELSLVRNYIYLQNLRFADKIHLQINNTADADKLYLPPLLIHTFVENSVVHGFSPDIKDFTISIDIHPDGKDYVDITITDNGLGLSKPTQAQQALKDKTSIGVDATRRRLQKLSEFYKVDYKLEITDRQVTEGVPGARISIRFYAHLGSLLPVG